ncbi:hypothetical protein ACH5RR_029981 [Cinchona calisaya]|uniref:Uncharacterized protein n=1 Tax=Cinchona calisaya TaxID=153742 RepID=A0ABD2YX34_9GENT
MDLNPLAMLVKYLLYVSTGVVVAAVPTPQVAVVLILTMGTTILGFLGQQQIIKVSNFGIRSMKRDNNTFIFPWNSSSLGIRSRLSKWSSNNNHVQVVRQHGCAC